MTVSKASRLLIVLAAICLANAGPGTSAFGPGSFVLPGNPSIPISRTRLNCQNSLNSAARGTISISGFSGGASGTNSFTTPSVQSVHAPLSLPIPCCKYSLDNWVTCAECYEGYELDDSHQVCMVIFSWNGRQASSSSGSSNLCGQGQYPANNRCWNIAPNCFTYDSCGDCLSCRVGLQLVNSRCQAPAGSNPCSFFRDGLCQQCAEGTTMMRPGYCQLNEPNCVAFNERGQCRGCRRGFVLENDHCLQMQASATLFSYTDENCLEWRAGTCVRCMAGRYRMGLGGYCSDAFSNTVISPADSQTFIVNGAVSILNGGSQVSSSSSFSDAGFIKQTTIINPAPVKVSSINSSTVVKQTTTMLQTNPDSRAIPVTTLILPVASSGVGTASTTGTMSQGN